MNMRLAALFALAALMCALAFVQAQEDDVGPIGPITTDNGISACVEFGSCTQGGDFATTETQLGPITPPPPSQNIAGPTNAIESSNYISNLAATGAAAAFSSRLANGQGAGNSPNGATVRIDTAAVIAGSPPANPMTTNAADDGSNAASHVVAWSPSSALLMALFTAMVGMAAGGAFLL